MSGFVCEICDRDAFEVYCAARRRGEPLPRGDGRGWIVAYRPVRHQDPIWLQPARFPLIHRVFTCGDDVCMHRAQRNGVPGRAYRLYSDEPPRPPSGTVATVNAIMQRYYPAWLLDGA